MFQTIFANQKGEVYEHPGLGLVGRTGDLFCIPQTVEMIPLPEGATLTLIPESMPLGVDHTGQFVLNDENPYGRGKIQAVGALLPQGYTRTLLPAFRRSGKNVLPLLGYTAVGWKNGKFYVAAIKTDEAEKWNPLNYNTPNLDKLVADKIKKHKGNRIIEHLARCAREYCCLTAQNIFYGRWEGGIPVSPTCNAMCLGCISKQPAECCPSPQNRIEFIPTVKEVSEIGIRHLQFSSEAIISFGQGCEGEPSLAADVIAESIYEIRKKTDKGTININTNAGFTVGIKKVVDSGLDSMRVSIISFDPKKYNAYYRPQNYSLNDVLASINYAKSKNVFVALNLLVYPGLTDTAEEVNLLIRKIQEMSIDMVQLRNLNIDPDFLGNMIPSARSELLGIRGMIKQMQKQMPELIIGSFSRPLKN